MRVAFPLVLLIASTNPTWAVQHHLSPNPVHADWATPSAITIDTVRSYVSMMGIAQAREVALANGLTRAQERRARRCLTTSR